MKSFVCMNCGNKIVTDENITSLECEACGEKYEIADLINYKEK